MVAGLSKGLSIAFLYLVPLLFGEDAGGALWAEPWVMSSTQQPLGCLLTDAELDEARSPCIHACQCPFARTILLVTAKDSACAVCLVRRVQCVLRQQPPVHSNATPRRAYTTAATLFFTQYPLLSSSISSFRTTAPGGTLSNTRVFVVLGTAST